MNTIYKNESHYKKLISVIGEHRFWNRYYAYEAMYTGLKPLRLKSIKSIIQYVRQHTVIRA